MEEWQQRLLDEKRELLDKISKLCIFINMDIFGNLSDADQALLHLQLSIMKAYVAVLKARTVSLKIEEK